MQITQVLHVFDTPLAYVPVLGTPVRMPAP
ncbi:hypothetical protein FRC0276_00308 [Corynebacterium diphtheriae]|nr:hypothetical protein FRC0276_00308 [Corynebacterium diphtheriae]